MSDIYQEIWTADQGHNGVEPIAELSEKDDARGYVLVAQPEGDRPGPDFKVLQDVVIPDAKQATYRLCRKLFDNYALPEADIEVHEPQEREERHAFLEAILETPPMQVARDYVAFQTQTTISRERWHNTLMDHWFREFSQGGDPALTGFEHVIVGEQERAKVQGYHFWYKYYLDDGFGHLIDQGRGPVPGAEADRIDYIANKAKGAQHAFPESVTLSYRWEAPDYERGEVRPLTKKIGGFFVGCSVEGLMALGSVRAHLGANAPRQAVIEGALYDMKLFHSGNGRHIRTFYPIFKGAVDPVNPRPVPVPHPTDPVPHPTPQPAPAEAGDVRILAMLVNPDGNDVGEETVTLAHAGAGAITLAGWKLQDKNGRVTDLSAVHLRPGYPETLTLDGAGVQLSNKGSEVSLLNAAGQVAHRVSYTKSQARRENRTLIFG